MTPKLPIYATAILALVASLSGCKYDDSSSSAAPPAASSSFTIGGTVAGLATGQQVTLLDNGANSLTLNANGPFTFASSLSSSAAYGVTVGTQPNAEMCLVASGSGTVGSSNVTNVAVSCAPVHNLYVSDSANAQIFQYTIQANGTLVPVGSGVATAAGPSTGVAVDPVGPYLYATLYGSNSVEQFTIASNGSLTPMTTPTLSAGSSPYRDVVSPNGHFLFVGDNAGGSVTSYSIGINGALTLIGTYTSSAGTNIQGLAVDPASTHLYVVGAQNSLIDAMTINSNGSLIDVGSISAGVTNPAYVTVDPTGTHLLTASHTSLGIFTITAGTGALTFVSAPTVSGTGAMQLDFDPTGTHLYLGMEGSNTVDQFSWSAPTATPLSPAFVSLGATQTAVWDATMDTTGQYYFTVNRNSKDISEFVVGTGGVLSANPGGAVLTLPASPIPDPYSVAVR